MISDNQQWAELEKARAEDQQLIHRLRRRVQALEGCLVYAKNFLPKPLKEQAEEILFPHGEQDPSIRPVE
jgi:hypothetical protein